MSKINFNELCRVLNTPIFLESAVVKSLLSTSYNYFPAGHTQIRLKKASLFGSTLAVDLELSHQIVRTAPNEWHIIADKLIGQGSFGSVYRSNFKIVITQSPNSSSAQIMSVTDAVKIQKIIKTQTFEKEREAAISAAERQATHGVNVIAVITHGAERIITVSEYCGKSLYQFFRDPLRVTSSFQSRLQRASSIAREMLLLQQKEIIHGDIKPDNMCVPADKRSVLFIDFGSSAKPSSWEAGQCAGSVDYIAPEVLFGGKKRTYQSDIYALSGVFGELFGAKNILKFKDKVYCEVSHRAVAPADYCFDGLFTDYDVSRVDPFILRDIHRLLMQLQNPVPERRPTIHQVLKFFCTIPGRLDKYIIFKNDWNLMVRSFEQLDRTHQQLLRWQNKFPDKCVANVLNGHLNRELTQKKMELYNEFARLTVPKSHYELSVELTLQNRLADFEEKDSPYPNLKRIIKLLQREQQVFDKLIQHLEQGLVIHCGNKLEQVRIYLSIYARLITNKLPLEQLQAIGLYTKNMEQNGRVEFCVNTLGLR